MEAEDPETAAAMQKVAAAIAKLPKQPANFSLMEKQEGGGYVQGGDSVPPPRHGSKVDLMLRKHTSCIAITQQARSSKSA